MTSFTLPAGERDDARDAALVEDLRRRAVGEKEGLFGPRSAIWDVSRELAVLLGGGRALLLQLAHPAVAHAVAHHSRFWRDPRGRGVRTFEVVSEVTWGDLETALAAGRRVRAMHSRVADVLDDGRPYHANDPHLLLWVHATLVDTTLDTFQRVVRPLAPDEAEHYYADTRLGVQVFGLAPQDVPATLREFRSWFRAMLDGRELAVGSIARAQADELLRQRPSDLIAGVLAHRRNRRLLALADAPPLRRALLESQRVMTAGLLPPRLRRAYGLAWSWSDERLFRSSLALVRSTLPYLPPRLRYHPEYLRALARVGAFPSGAPFADRRSGMGESSTRQ